MRIAVVGAGDMGAVHARAYYNIQDVDIAYICARNVEKVAPLAQELGVVPTTDFNSILQDKTIDAIDICVPSEVHHEFVIPALEAGKHVFCETPLALNMEHAEAMLKASKENNRLLLVGLLTRSIASYRYIKRAVDKGDLGDIQAIYAYRLGSYLRYNSRDNKEHYGDPTTELMTFDFDFINWLMGTRNTLSARAVFTPEGKPGHIFATLQYDNAVAEIEASGIMPQTFPYSVGFRIFGKKEMLELTTIFHTDGPPKSVLMAYPHSGKPYIVDHDDHDPYQVECQCFIDCILDNADPALLSAERAIEALRLSVATQNLIRQDMIKSS